MKTTIESRQLLRESVRIFDQAVGPAVAALLEDFDELLVLVAGPTQEQRVLREIEAHDLSCSYNSIDGWAIEDGDSRGMGHTFVGAFDAYKRSCKENEP